MDDNRKSPGRYDIEIIHTIPKMTELELEQNKKMIANELYEIFLRMHSQLHPNEPSKAGEIG